MKILFLNTWGGRAGREKLLSFISNQRDKVDIFCFQEVWAAPYEHHEGALAGGREIKHEDIMVHGLQEIVATLPDHEYFFHPHYLENYGLLMFVRKNVDVVGSGDVFVYRERGHIPTGDIGNHARNIQYVTFKHSGSMCTVINFHGLWNGKGKTDSKERLEQSQKIIDFVQNLKGEVVLGGDFNLLPDTESIALIEHAAFRNLIKEFNVTSTRTSFYDKEEKYADYVFTSGGIKTEAFNVLRDEVSDHAPLLLEIQ